MWRRNGRIAGIPTTPRIVAHSHGDRRIRLLPPLERGGVLAG
jgi:hypothetical protein